MSFRIFPFTGLLLLIESSFSVDSRFDGVEAVDEPLSPDKGIIIDDGDGNIAHQCLLSAVQVEEIYLRTYKGEHEGESKVCRGLVTAPFVT